MFGNVPPARIWIDSIWLGDGSGRLSGRGKSTCLDWVEARKAMEEAAKRQKTEDLRKNILVEMQKEMRLSPRVMLMPRERRMLFGMDLEEVEFGGEKKKQQKAGYRRRCCLDRNALPNECTEGTTAWFPFRVRAGHAVSMETPAPNIMSCLSLPEPENSEIRLSV